MKKLYLIFSILFFIILSHPIIADTIIDSVYSVPELDGTILFNPEGEPELLNNFTYEMQSGDTGVPLIPGPPPNSCNRSFVSFELPQIPGNCDLDSVYIRLYQNRAICNGSELGGFGFPEWNIPGGDTIKCILSHIDYGDELDEEDWEKGNVGNPYTFTHNAGTVIESSEDGYRYIDVTDCILYDYQQERSLTQYRISFQIDSDNDSCWDLVAFKSGDSGIDAHKPQLFFYLSDNLGVNNNLLNYSDFNFQVYPNPTSKNCRIMLYSKKTYSINVKIYNIKIYNIKGQLVQTVFTGNIERGENEILFDTKELSNGIYFLKAKTDNQVFTKKIIIMK
jgi:hypothetical protein